MRDYRPGDSMRDIHWKLSVKTDRTIVREAQEPVPVNALVTFDLKGNQAQADSLLEHLLWISGWLLEHEAAHEMIWVDPADSRQVTETVKCPEDLDRVLTRLLRTRLREDVPSVARRKFPHATWRCHVEP